MTRSSPIEVIRAMDTKKTEWDQSYKNKDNFVFYPHEEVIRFTAGYLRKRMGLESFVDRHAYSESPRVIDVGCGIGRHVVFLHEMGLEAYGIELSDEAVDFARRWSKRVGMEAADSHIVQGDISKPFPWPDGFFHAAVSHGVLDSMPFDIALASVDRLGAVLVDNGLFYCDLISGDDSSHAREYSGEETVTTDHEKGTVQSYFNFQKINEIFKFGIMKDDRSHYRWKLESAKLIRAMDVVRGHSHARWHIVARKSVN